MDRNPRRRFPDDFDTQAVALAESIGPAKVARHLDMSVKTLANWRVTARAGNPFSSATRQPVGELESELARLRTENAMLGMGCEILKKRRRCSPRNPSEVRFRRS